MASGALAEHALQEGASGRAGANGNSQEQSFVKALGVVFKDPATGKVKTDQYIAYLHWQRERLELVGKMLDAESDTAKRIFARKMTTLDRDFSLFNPEIKMAMDILSAADFKLYQDASSLQKIKDHDGAAHDAWQKERGVIVDAIKKESDDQKKQFLAGKLNAVDHAFKIQFMGFLLGLTAK